MKILIVSGIFPPDAGGPATYVHRMAGELSSRGHHVRIVTLAHGEGERIAPTPFEVIRIGRHIWLPLRILRCIFAIVRHGRGTDVLFVSGLPLESAAANLYLRRPIVQKIVGDWAWERATNAGATTDDFVTFQRSRSRLRVEALKQMRAFLTSRADRVIVPSAFLAQVVEGWGVIRDRIRVIYNAAEPWTDSVATSPPVRPRTIVTVGRLVKWKRVDDIVRAVSALDAEVELLIIGDGPEEARLRELVRDLGLDARVRFTGRLERSRVLALMKASTVCVLNSTYEGLPHVVLEAMHLGVPVVATAAGGTGEVVRHGETGLLVPPGDLPALRDALARLIGDQRLRQELGEAGRSEARTRFSFDRMADETEHELAATVAEFREAGTPSDSASPDRSVREQAFVLGLISAAGAALGLIQGIVVARALGPADFGAAALILAYPALVSGILDARSGDFSMKYLGEFAGEARKASAVCALGLLIDLGVMLLTLAFVLGTRHWAGEHVVRVDEGPDLMAFYAVSLIGRVPVGTFYSVLVLLARWDRLLWAELGSSFLRAAAIIGLAFAGFGVRGVIWGNIAGVLIQGVAFTWAGLPIASRAWAAPRLGALRHLQGRWGELCRFVGFSELHALFLTFPRQLDLLLVGSLAGPQQAGYFRLGRTFQAGLWLVGAPVQQIAFRQISLLRGQQGREQAKRFTRRLALALVLLFAVPLLAVIAGMPLVVRTVAGEAFIGASPALRLLFAATALWVIGAWIRPWFLTEGRIDRYTIMLGLALVPYLVIAVWATPTWGAAGMAFGYLVYSVVLLVPLGAAILK